MSASARLVATIRRFGFGRSTTAVAAVDRGAPSSLTGSGAPSSRSHYASASPKAAAARSRRSSTVPASPRVLIASAAALIVLALPAVASAAPPTASIKDPANVAYVTADVSGIVNPADNETYFCFETALTKDVLENGLAASWSGFCYEGSVAANEPATDVPTGSEYRQLTGLTPATEYNVRLTAWNFIDPEVHSEEKTFTTNGPVAKPTITGLTASEITGSGAHLSAEVDPGGTDPAFDASWHFECVPACSGLQGATVTGAQGETEVTNDATGLLPNTTYTLRLIATNAGGTRKSTTTFSTPGAAPQVKLYSAGPLTATTAGINAAVNPGGASTTYYFEWGTEDCSIGTCASIPPSREADAGSGAEFNYVSRHLSGLTPQSTYHFRLVAKNASGIAAGTDQTFTTPAPEAPCANQGMPGTSLLPDCRAWEMASPSAKNGGDVAPITSRTRAAIDGSAVDFVSLTGFGDVGGLTIGTESLAQRTAAPGTSGWQTHSISPPQNPITASGTVLANGDPAYEELSPDLTSGIYRAYRPITDAPDVTGLTNLYVRKDLRTPGAGSYQLISDPSFPMNPLIFPQQQRPFVAGASTDLSHVIFESKLPLDKSGDLSSCSPLFGCNVQLFESVDGVVRLAGVLPDRTPASSSQAGRGVGKLNPVTDATYNPRMISADGRRVFFQAPAGVEGNIYMRVDGTATVQLNASERSSEPKEAPQSATLWTASADGHRVFFSTSEGLVDGDNHGAVDYYMYDVDASAGHHLTLISGDGSGSALGVAGASDDGHYLYFEMTGRLVPGEGQPGGYGIYAWHDGVVRLIGNFNRGSDFALNTLEGVWQGGDLSTRARVSADGTHLAFVTTNDEGFRGRGGFPGFDHGTACSGLGCQELYVYDAEDGRLRCASCDPSGGPPTGRVMVGGTVDQYASGISKTTYLNRALSTDGRWAFFSSPDPLVPEDTNDKFDAYSYDTATEEVHLLSSGTSDQDSYFMDTSADGRDAFFVTRERLLGWDIDSSFDLYDARVGGGFPEPAPVPAPCEADSCHPAAVAPRLLPPLGSTQPGPGNPKSRRQCPKAKHSVRRAGKVRCVPNRHHKQNADSDRRAGR